MLIKHERKKRNPTLVMTVGALAAVGAVTIVRGAKRIVRCTGEKVRGVLRVRGDGEEC